MNIPDTAVRFLNLVSKVLAKQLSFGMPPVGPGVATYVDRRSRARHARDRLAWTPLAHIARMLALEADYAPFQRGKQGDEGWNKPEVCAKPLFLARGARLDRV